MKKSTMTHVQTIALHALMSQHCQKGDDGYARYEEGWDDDRILAEINKTNPTDRPYSKPSVTNLRLAMFGKVRVPPVAGVADQLAKLQAEVASMQERLTALEQWAGARTKQRYMAPPGRPQATPPTE